jgi:hypothetical protein
MNYPFPRNEMAKYFFLDVGNFNPFPALIEFLNKLFSALFNRPYRHVSLKKRAQIFFSLHTEENKYKKLFYYVKSIKLSRGST